MNQALVHYENLKQATNSEDTIGIELPKLHAAQLNISSKLCTTAELSNILSPWLAAEGWYQTRNATALGMPEKLNELIEGQWQINKCTLHLRLIGANQYQVTELSQADNTDSQFCYQDQTIWLRSNLCSSTVNAVNYRHWWQLENHAYRPIAAQFMGLTFIKE